MTAQEQKQNFKRKSEQLDTVTKPIRNAVWLIGIFAALWVQFLGPGMTSALRELSGSNALSDKMDEGFEAQSARLDFIEDNIQPPKVAVWNFNRQLGECTPKSTCRVLHNIARTAYGESCGVPVASVDIRLEDTGQVFDLLFGDNFEAGDATRTGRNFIVPLVLEDIIPAGVHEYRFTNIYPTCEWSREPIPRYSPWFKIIVTTE